MKGHLTAALLTRNGMAGGRVTPGDVAVIHPHTIRIAKQCYCGAVILWH